MPTITDSITTAVRSRLPLMASGRPSSWVTATESTLVADNDEYVRTGGYEGLRGRGRMPVQREARQRRQAVVQLRVAWVGLRSQAVGAVWAWGSRGRNRSDAPCYPPGSSHYARFEYKLGLALRISRQRP